MSSLDSVWKRASIVLFLFLLSCQKSPRWELSKTKTRIPQYNSGRMFFSQEGSRNLEIELDYGVSGLRMYLNVFSLEIPSLTEHPELTLVTVEIETEKRTFQAHLFTGGQRLLLPDIARDWIVAALFNDSLVTISTGRYRSVIPPLNFNKLFTRLVKS